MPRWRSLPEELDPEIREFTGQLRGLLDRGGLSIAAVADRTGYSKSSWERFLNGRMLPPRAAVHALAEVAQTDLRHLETMWDLAERAWSREEMRRDAALEAVRVSQARAALGTPLGEPADEPAGEPEGAPADEPAGRRSAPPDSPNGPVLSAESASEPPEAPDRPKKPDSPHSPHSPHSSESPDQPVGPPQYDLVAPPIPGGPKEASRRKRRIAVAWTGVAAVLAVVAVALAVFDLAAPDSPRAGPSSHSSRPTSHPTSAKPHEPPIGADRPGDPGGPGPDDSGRHAPVKCHGDECDGRNPERMGCGGRNAESAASARVGDSRIEVRYSSACHAAWGRLTRAGHGDGLKVSADGTTVRNQVGAGHETFTTMVAATSAAQARACATLTSGTKGCTGAESGR